MGRKWFGYRKLGDDSWALISLAPGQVWPQVRNFMAASGMQIVHADARDWDHGV